MSKLRTAEYALTLLLRSEGNLVTRRGGLAGEYSIHSLDTNNNTTIYKVVLENSYNRTINTKLIDKLIKLETRYEVKCFIAVKIPRKGFKFIPLTDLHVK